MFSRGTAFSKDQPTCAVFHRAVYLGAFFAIAVLAACGGGGGAGANPPVPVPPTTFTAAPVPGPTATPTAAAMATLTFSIVVPRATLAKRQPQYVSSATQSVRVRVNGGTPVVANVAPGSPGCVAAPQGTQCSVNTSAPVGVDTILVELFGQLNAGGPTLSQGVATATIVAGAANTIPIALNGVVAKVVLALANRTPPQGAATTIALTVTMLDASGATIIGDPFVSPVTLTDSDTSGATSINRTTLTSPADAVGLTVSYNGAAIGPVTFGATVSGVPAGNVTTATLTPMMSTPTPSPSPTPKPTPTPVPTPSPTPKPTPTPVPANLVDWPTYGFDNHRDGFNPSAGALTPAALANLHLAWRQLYGDYGTQSQPVLATKIGGHPGLLFVGGSLGIVYAFDASTGTRAWQTSLGTLRYQCDNGSQSQTGIGGTVAYDPASRSLYVSSNANSAPNAPATNAIVRLDAASGAQLGSVTIGTSALPGEFNIAHTGITLANGFAYAGTGSSCDIPSWRGRVAAVSANASGNANIAYTTYGVGGNFSGGGVWSWGGVAVDDGGAVYAGVGNADTSQGATGPQPPFTQTTNEQAGYGDHVIKLSSDLSSVIAANYPGGNVGSADDLDFAGTPVLFKPLGCNDTLLASEGKAGQVVVYDTLNVGAGPIASFRISPTTSSPADIGNPAWSPSTGLLYINVTSGSGGAIDPPGMIALRPSGCNGSTSFSVAWHTSFGPDSFSGSAVRPRSAPTVTAGGVVFTGTPCSPDGNGGCGPTITTNGGALWALDAVSGVLLNNGLPVLLTGSHIRAPAVADGTWVYVQDDGAGLYGLTIDPSVKAIQARRSAVIPRETWYPSKRSTHLR